MASYGYGQSQIPATTRYAPQYRSLYNPVLAGGDLVGYMSSSPLSLGSVTTPLGDGRIPVARQPVASTQHYLHNMNSTSSLSSVGSLVPRMIHVPGMPYKMSPQVQDISRDVEMAISLSLPFLDPLSLWSVRLLNTRVRTAATNHLSITTVGPILDLLDRFACCPFFLSSAADDPGREIAKLNGAWCDAPPHPKDPPPSALFIPFSGSVMALLWNTVLPRAVFVPPLSWGTMCTPHDTRLFLSRALTFHESDMESLNSVQRSEVKKLWSILDVNLAALTATHKLHALYLEANHPEKVKHALCQLHLLMHERRSD